jgi:oligoribonuclease
MFTIKHDFLPENETQAQHRSLHIAAASWMSNKTADEKKSLQMTGLDAETDSILSIACFITDAQLNFLDDDDTGFEAVVYHSAAQLDAMNEWCIRTHTASGLVEQCKASRTTADDAVADLLSYIRKLVPVKGVALLAGNSVHADKMFLLKPPWNQVLEYLHYRILDVSAVKEAARRWCSDDVLQGVPRKAGKHEAKADILESIEEARYYRGMFGQMRNLGLTGTTGLEVSVQTDPVLEMGGAGREAVALGSRLGATDRYGNGNGSGGGSGSGASKRVGVKRTAEAAGLRAPRAASTLGIGGWTQSVAGGAMGKVHHGMMDDEGFRTDVP